MIFPVKSAKIILTNAQNVHKVIPIKVIIVYKNVSKVSLKEKMDIVENVHLDVKYVQGFMNVYNVMI